MARFAAVAALALLFSRPLEAGVEVTANGERWDVTAAAAPVTEVLDGLARKTRMKVVYEGTAPRTTVTVEMRDRTPAQAVLGVLEGLGLNYALVLDASGTQVETLMIMGAAGRTASAAAPIRPARSSRREAPEVEPDAPMAEADELLEIEGSVPAAPGEVAPADEKAKAVPTPPLPGAPAFPGPLNPTIAVPGSTPFAPGPLPVPGPQPVFPGQQPGPGQQPVAPGQQPVTPSPSPNSSTSD